jgi:hypothetical protein
MNNILEMIYFDEMELKTKTPKSNIPKHQKVYLFIFILLIVVYIFTILGIRNMYNTQISPVSKNDLPISDNYSYFLNTDISTDNSWNTDNILNEDINVSDVVTPTIVPTNTIKPSINPTKKINT